jgi:hypothetical protein
LYGRAECLTSQNGGFPAQAVEEWQRINHFRNNYELTRKDHMVMDLKRIPSTFASGTLT